MTHTPEPWAIQSHGLPEGLHGIIAPHHTKWFVAEDCKKVDAIRIVACVNACAGIDTVTLENFARGYPTAWDMVRELKQQNAELKEQSSRLAAEAVRQAQQNADLCVKNAELLAAAKDVIKRWDAPLWEERKPTSFYMHKLREAIAKAGKS